MGLPESSSLPPFDQNIHKLGKLGRPSEIVSERAFCSLLHDLPLS